MPTTVPFTQEQTWLECIGCGHKADLLAARAFRCPLCNNLYDVRHDFGCLDVRDRVALLDRFDARALARAGQDPRTRSGVWRFHELVMPHLPIDRIVTLGEGLVPILPAGRTLREWIGGDIDLWIIFEGLTQTGSFKDFGMTVLMSIAKAAGIEIVVCTSTGDTSASLAAFAAEAGLRCVVILPFGRVTPVQLVQPVAHGARVITVPGEFDVGMRIMEELVARYGVYPGNSLNPARIEGHQATVFLVAQLFDWTLPHWFVVPIGNGSNISSVGKGRRLLRELQLVSTDSRILGCQSEAASPIARAWWDARSSGDVTEASWAAAYKPMKDLAPTTATAAWIGNPVSRDKVMREIVASEGAMQIASEKDLNEAVFVTSRDGHFVCPQTGIALAGLRNAVREGWVKGGERVVVVSTATGLKFTEPIAERAKDVITNAPDCETDTVAKIIGVA